VAASAASASPAAPGPQEPEDLTCPISACLYRDPVMLVSGHTFERASIVEFWRRRPLANPLGTGERLKTAQMIINYGCRSQVDSWLERHPGYVPEGWASREDKRRSTQSVRARGGACCGARRARRRR
jgi:leucine-rich repeat protein SHOC2